MAGPIRAAVVGGRRGRGYRRAFSALPEQVTLSAICDRSEAVLDEWRQEFPELLLFSRYEDLLEADACDAVFIATPIQAHVQQALAALAAGKDVLVEVPAATTLEECWALIEAVERSGRTFMMAENYCYTRPNMMVRHLVEAGVFGRTTYAEGAYIHDTRNLLFTPDGELTWRGQIARDLNGNTYPTHSLGPVAQWLGTTGPAPSDRFEELVCYVTPETSRWRYAAEQFGKDHPAAQPDSFRMGDSASVLLRTEGGAVAYIRRDAASQRPHNMTHYALQGERASYLSPRHEREDPLVWIEGRSPGQRFGKEEWQPLWDYASEYEHPRWKLSGAVAREAGHGGGDYFIVEDFVRAVREGTPPAVDVYDAVTWSSVFPLSVESVAQGGQPVKVPDFRRAR
ncbi:MAG: GH109 [uncultured Chloroflexi bacterium]|uniref:GH109 n=1 Tax=uncultured Chloroflexota bacterium TaxID=166587 RepID=A0A6J4HDN4_9CHLR|nr:MAG: GH109 [uncultured Chloroflexota bacterium]